MDLLLPQQEPTMSLINVFQRGYLAFALVAALITLYSGQVAAMDCTYHWDIKGKVPGRSSCQSSPHQDNSCIPSTCRFNGLALPQIVYQGCHAPGNPSARTDQYIYATQYYRRDQYGYASVPNPKGGWADCDYSVKGNGANNAVYMSCSSCYRV
ncbi:hypothetical protein PGT21_027382 [Puccinia graminis f. sp. tritici]|uniref:Uncharacterized protein n=1 Tax=Puccinia graminis f. sp. tritici TaxID=56615 RepID=A0A5B0LYK2_PUCGR|nr:hypothetical protein PGT21_027382 [Puccinia graminis f. sp. tritici]